MAEEKNEDDGVSRMEVSRAETLNESFFRKEEIDSQFVESDDESESYEDDKATVIAVKAEIEESAFDIFMSELTQDNVYPVFSLSKSASNKEQIPEIAEDDSPKRKRRLKTESVTLELVEAREKFNPLEYYAKYDQLLKEYEFEQNKNNLLQKKLRDYLVRKKMYHHLVSSGKEFSMDARRKYEKELNNLASRLEETATKSGAMIEELANLRKKHSETEKEAESVYDNLVHAEKDVAKEILSHEDAEGDYHRKVIDTCLKRQKNQLTNIIKMRYQHIKLRNRMTEVQKALSSLDKLGPDFRLIDYEGLKIDNRNLVDKLEERENELIRIRRKCQNAVQTLAHIREKSDNVDRKITKLKEALENIEFEYSGLRMTMADIMQERDWQRKCTTELKNRSILLAKPKLLRDMENTVDEIQRLREEIEKIKEEYKRVTERVYKLREFLSLAS